MKILRVFVIALFTLSLWQTQMCAKNKMENPMAKAVEPLKAFLKDPSPYIRSQVAITLYEYGIRSPEVVKQLTETITRKWDYEYRVPASMVKGGFMTPAELAVRAVKAKALGELPLDGPEIVALLENAVKAPGADEKDKWIEAAAIRYANCGADITAKSAQEDEAEAKYRKQNVKTFEKYDDRKRILLIQGCAAEECSKK